MIKNLLIFFLCLSSLSVTAQEAKAKLKPGKFDTFFKSRDNATEYNAILWTPTIKAGLGAINRLGEPYSIYGGGFFRPSQLMKVKGEWIVGFGFQDTEQSQGVELQSEYRLPSGWSFGAGYVNSDFFESPAGPERSDDYFAKFSYRKNAGDWKGVLSSQIQEVHEYLSFGGFAALYNVAWSFAGGYDGELWRGSVGYISKQKSDSNTRLALEALYIDKSIGNNTIAPKILWINGTVGFKGGFLSHAARLGRAMGATGFEYANPLPYLIPLNDGNSLFPGSPAIWNRALNVWELGVKFNFRLFHLKLPNESNWGRLEAVLFPFQLDSSQNSLENIFLGAVYAYHTNTPNDSDLTNPGVMLGINQRVSQLQAHVEVEYFFETKSSILNVGVINWF